MEHRFNVVQRSEILRSALDRLFALTLTERALSRLIGDEAVNLAKFLHTQEENPDGARWGDVEDLANILWEKGGRLAERTSGDRSHPMAIRLMEIADTLSFECLDAS